MGPHGVRIASADTPRVDSMIRIVARVSSTARRLRILPESYHLIACDVERVAVAAEVATWCERYLGAA